VNPKEVGKMTKRIANGAWNTRKQKKPKKKKLLFKVDRRAMGKNGIIH